MALTSLLALLTLHVIISLVAAQTPLRYSIVEESNNSFVGDVIEDSGLRQQYTQSELDLMNFVFVENDEAHETRFIINRGLLETRGPVDRDNICPNLEICVIPMAIKVQPTEFFAIIQLEVEIVDVNDNSPTFAATTEVLHVSESTNAGSLLDMPQAADADSPQFSVQFYEMSPTSSQFRLHQETVDGLVQVRLELLQPLDRELEDTYSSTLFAYDGGNPVNSASVDITIKVSDSNDNRPVFQPTDYDVSVPENLSVGVSVAQVTATDQDSGPNAQIVYSFDTETQSQSGSMFRIDSQSGRIFLQQLLNFETRQRHILTVLAKDNYPDYSGAVAKVTINVIDYNDNRPDIKINDVIDGQSVQVPENEPEAHFVAHLTVEDADSGDNGQFECSIDEENFVLERLYPTEFKIITAVSFDRETRSQYTIRMVCQDNGSPRQRSSLTIPVIINDANDHAPIFQSVTFVGSTLENTAAGVSIMRVSAADRDLGVNARIEYRIDGSMMERFDVGQFSGNISARVALDYERQSSYTFTVTAVDGGTPPLSATATVIIDVADVDDNTPLFSMNSYTFSVPEHDGVSSYVGQVTATDADSPPFDRFYYVMQNNDAFRIENETGMIYTKRVFDREQYSTPVFTTHVYAVSAGFRPTTSSAVVTIHIADINDKAPVITFPNNINNTIYIMDTRRRGDVIGYVQAHDDDHDINARLTYRIVNGNIESTFLIDATDGSILVNKDLASVGVTAFGLDIRVEDGGTPTKHAVAFMNIVVNKSLPSNQEDPKKTNLSIVISIACVSGCVIVVLIVAIAFIVMQKRRQKQRSRYNNVPKVFHKDPFMQISLSDQMPQEKPPPPGYIGAYENSGFSHDHSGDSREGNKHFHRQVSVQ